jgi:hypothetical protein
MQMLRKWNFKICEIQESEPYGQLLDEYTNIRDVQQAVRHRTQLTENTSFDYSQILTMFDELFEI